MRVAFGVLLVFYTLVSQAQDLVLDLYQGLPPHSTGIYTEEQWNGFKVDNVQIPQLYVYKANAENNTGYSVMFLPGGGYKRLSIYRMGEKYAEFFREMGVTTFVLKYRLPVSQNLEQSHLVPYTDAIQAMRLIQHKADELGIQKDKIGLLGSSAGGHLASMLCTQPDTLTSISSAKLPQALMPKFAILLYPVTSMDPDITHRSSMASLLGHSPSEEIIQWASSDLNIKQSTPPTFIVHGYNDEVVSIQNSIRYYSALVQHGVPAEAHFFQDGKHGSGAGKKGEPWSYWRKLCAQWMKKHILQN